MSEQANGDDGAPAADVKSPLPEDATEDAAEDAASVRSASDKVGPDGDGDEFDEEYQAEETQELSDDAKALKEELDKIKVDVPQIQR